MTEISKVEWALHIMMDYSQNLIKRPYKGQTKDFKKVFMKEI